MITQKQALAAAGVEHLHRWCSLNGLAAPSLTVVQDGWKIPACGYYRSEAIRVCVPLCASLGYAGRAWSWPGYAVDRTPFGVIAHETGHWIDDISSTRRPRAGGTELSRAIRAAAKEPAITGYAPNGAEWFAEMFKLFITNPDLLRLTRPRTYSEITRRFKPLDLGDWRTALINHRASDRIIRAAMNRIEKAKATA